MVRRLPTIDVSKTVVASAGCDESKAAQTARAIPLMDAGSSAEESPSKAISEHDASPGPLAKTMNESSPSEVKVPSASLALLAAVQNKKANDAKVAKEAREKKKQEKAAADPSVPVVSKPSKGKKRKGAEASAKRCNAGYTVELSRNNVQARTGWTGPGQNKGFKFGGARKYKTLASAINAAEKWLAKLSN